MGGDYVWWVAGDCGEWVVTMCGGRAGAVVSGW